MMRKLFLFAGGFLLLINACKKDDNYKPGDPGYEYYPLGTGLIGMERIYDVDSVVYRKVNSVPDTFVYQVKERLSDTFTDLSGQLAYVVEKSIRMNDTMPWNLNYSYTMNRNELFAEEFNQNTRFVKLAFPLREGKVFNSNLYNAMPPTKSKITSLNTPYDMNSLHFDSTVLVTHINDSDFLNRDMFVERFARGVGLISREYISIDKIVTGPDTKLEGSRYTYRLRSFSK